jgi:hypothetical protein
MNASKMRSPNTVFLEPLSNLFQRTPPGVPGIQVPAWSHRPRIILVPHLPFWKYKNPKQKWNAMECNGKQKAEKGSKREAKGKQKESRKEK